ncbi:response regulator [Chitinophagaceae bacterium LB-8]|jgi:DNA-binding NtrC family response regulator|uniref:Response regulator n=1 Tax=Paraflavisolibacter caeni TaxID=2982496 RepID=A0A9X3BJE8_9BACT|nr:response regulator [Paraflavisolibacter caeni]MCU7552742.1 response regulator [Paraflavisolibacter caeni]
MKPHACQTKNILLIDDDEDDCLLMNLALEKLSNQVSLIYLSCTEKLWEALENCKPSLIVIDLHLPKRNGIEILKLIKMHSCYKEIPVIIWSTSYMTNHVIAAYNNGAQLFLEKPFDYKALVSALQRVIRMTKVKDELTSLQAFLG